MDVTPGMPYTMLLQQFHAAPPGKLYCLHGSNDVFRLSLTAAAHVLLGGVPMTLIDGTNRFDLYYLVEFARRFAEQQVRETHVQPMDPGDLLQNIFVARAFTCYQMEATITERLSAFVRKKGSPVVIIFGLLDTFYDDQAPLFEVKASLQRIIAALRRLKEERTSVLLASKDTRLASPERNALLPSLLMAMDRTYAVEEREGIVRITQEAAAGITPHNAQSRTGHAHAVVPLRPTQGGLYGKNSSDIHHGAPARDGKLGKIQARTSTGRPGGVR
jgi:hypothetical protein